MTEIIVDLPETTAALDRGRVEAEGTVGHTQAYEPQSTDPKVADLLRALTRQTGDTAELVEGHAVAGTAAAESMVGTDAESASTVAASPSSEMGGVLPSSRVSSATVDPSSTAAQQQQQQQLAAAQQQQMMAAAQQQQQQLAAAQQQQLMMAAAQQQQQQQLMMAAAQQQMAAAASASAGGLPPGTIFVDPNDLASLIEAVTSGDGSGNSTSSPWTGSTARSPIDINDVRYDKTHGTLSKEEVSTVIDSAMSKTGIDDPTARAKWKAVLEYMAWEESTNHASAVNHYDSNATGATQVDGSPAKSSRGTWQLIPTTFAAYHAAGTSNNIYDPEASAGAAINYMKDRHNIGTDGSGLDEFYAARAHGDYVGY